MSFFDPTRAGQVQIFQVHPLLSAAMPHGASAAGFVNENSPHRLSCGGEEVSSAVPFLILAAYKAKPGFMHQGRRLQGMARRLIRHFGRSQLA